MVRIPRTEAQVGFQPSQQPTWNSGSASAPGKAVASLGDALGNLGSAFTAEINQKNEFDDKLKVLQFQNQWEHDQIKDMNEFNRDEPSGFATERYGSYRQGVQELLPQLKSEKTKQWATLHLENHGSNVYERYQKFEYGKIGDKLYRDIDATITGEFGKPTLNNPDTIVKDIEGTLAGVEAIIKSSPGMVPDNRKEALRKAAADLALKKLDEVMTAAGREDELYDVTQGILKRMGIDPAARAPGPQSSAPASRGPVGTVDFSQGGSLRYNKSIPASIRHNNPGATYPAGWMKDYGMNGVDIIGGGHKIANFPDAISGAAANIDLMHRGYAGMTLSSAIKKWSGNNSPEAYAAHVSKVLGLPTDAVLTKEVIARDGWKILKAQSEFESGGKKFALSDEQWQAAQNMFRGKRGLGGPTETPAVASAPQGGRVAQAQAPAPATADAPEKQKVSLAGLDPKAKAAKLEELVGQGYQSVIHQLDNNGEDVLIVRKSDKPEWYKNFRGTGKGPSEFDKPDFAGPEWAGESIRKIRTGELRPQNTIPGAGNKVADASGNVVPIKPGMAVPGQQSAQSQFQEGLVRQLPALAKRSEMAKERWAKDISGQIKTIVDMAEKGYAPRDEDIAKLEEQLIRKPDLAQRYGLTDAALGAQEFINQQMQIRTLRPVELEAGLRAVQVEAQTNGATPELIKRKERMEKLLGEMRKGVNEDPIGWADRVGVAKADPIDWTKPESLANRVSLARTVAEHYGQPPQFFTKQERDELKDRLKIGGKQMLGMLGAMHQAFGPDTIYAMAEISKQAPEAATIGWMMSKGIAPQVVEDAAIGMERQAKRAMGEKGIVPIKPVEGRTAFIDVAGNAFSRLPSSEGALVETVNAAYEARAQRMGWAEPKADEWKKIMREVVGESTDKQGNVYGGFQSFGSGHKIILPPDVKNVEGTFRNSGNSFRMLMDAVRPEDLVNEFGAGPASGSNTPLSIGAVRNATPISVGEGRYLLAMGDPASDPMLVQDGAGNNFVLDLNALKDKLKARRPDLYQGYVEPERSMMPTGTLDRIEPTGN